MLTVHDYASPLSPPNSKRVEDQLKDVSIQSEEKRAQVRRWKGCVPRGPSGDEADAINSYSSPFQIIKIQQQAQAQAQRHTDPSAAAAA